MRPTSIIRFERLYAASLLLSLFSAVFLIPAMRATLPPGMPPTAARIIPIVMIGSLAGGIVAGVVLLHFIARRRSDTARLIFLALVALGLVFELRGAVIGGAGLPLPTSARALAVAQTAIQLVCAWLLFRPDARAWFAADRRR